MPDRDEIRGLHRELAEVQDRVDDLRRRIAALEHRETAVETPPPPVTEAAQVEMPPAAPAQAVEKHAVPPPLPPPRQAPPALEAAAVVESPAPIAVKAPRRSPFVEDTGPNIWERAGAALRALGPKEKMDWETAVVTHWMPRLAMLLLAVGVVWMSTWAIQQLGRSPWIPYARLAFGYVLCIGLLIGGKRLEPTAQGFARVLLSGGIGLSYFMTFATHYVEFTRIFTSPAPTLVLLGLLVFAWSLVADYRGSIFIAGAVALLGHATVALSTLTLDVPSPTAVAGLLVLSAGSGYFYVRRGWFVVAAIGLAGSYANHFLWLANSPGSDAPFDFAVAMAVLAGYWVIFEGADFFAGTDPARGPSMRVRTAYLSANAGAVLLLGMAVMAGFDFSRERLELFYWGFGGVLLAAGAAYVLRAKETPDPRGGAAITKGVAIATLGVAAYWDGAALTVSLGLESVVLLLAARRTGLLSTRLLALAAVGLTVGHAGYSVLEVPRVPYEAQEHTQRIVQAGLAAVALALTALLYPRLRWAVLPVERAPRNPLLRQFARWTELVGEPMGVSPYVQLPHVLAYAPAALMVFYGVQLTEARDLGAVWGALALALALVGVAAGSRAFTVASLGMTVFGCAAWHGHMAAAWSGGGGPGPLWVHLAALAPLLILSELSRTVRVSGGVWAGETSGEWKLPDVYALLGVLMAAIIAHECAPSGAKALWAAGGAAAAAAYALGAGAAQFGLAAALLGLVAGCYGTAEVFGEGSSPEGLAASALIAGVALMTESRWFGGWAGLRRLQSPWAPYLLYGFIAWLAALHVDQRAAGAGGMAALIGLAAGAAALSTALHARAWSVNLAMLLALAAMFWLDEVPSPVTDAWHALTAAYLAAAVLGERFTALRRHFPRGMPGGVMVGAAWIVAGSWTLRVPPDEWQYAAWLALGGAFLLYAATCGLRSAGLLAAMTTMTGIATLIARSYDGRMELPPMIAGYVCAILLSFAWERGIAWSLARMRFTPAAGFVRMAKALLAAAPCILLLMLLERIPAVSTYYLTIEWTAAGMGMFALGLILGHQPYRYAGLATFALALFRVGWIDTRELEPIYRIAGIVFLGIVLLGVSYVFLRVQRRQAPTPPGETDGGSPE